MEMNQKEKDIEMFNTSTIMFILLTIFVMMSSSHADTNSQAGSMCSRADNSSEDTSFQANLNTVLTSLSTNAPLENGFYKTSTGKGSNKVYGLVQCRGDLSSTDCANCTRESIKIALKDCPTSRDVTIWFRWCMLRYTNENILGDWEEKGSMETPTGNGTDGSVEGSKGSSMMSELSLTTKNQAGMFQTSFIDVGQGGKRYGLAQCRRDISKSDCGKCLESQLLNFREQIMNQRRWEIHGLGCSLWYNDFQFYFKNSTLATSGVERTMHRGEMGAVFIGLTLSIFL